MSAPRLAFGGDRSVVHRLYAELLKPFEAFLHGLERLGRMPSPALELADHPQGAIASGTTSSDFPGTFCPPDPGPALKSHPPENCDE
jgi:hypothetical protein